MKNLYNKDFYGSQSQGSFDSARALVPILMNLFKPKSVVDVGCGLGTWLKAFEEHGVHDIFGMDGEYVNKNHLLIDDHKFMSFDLRKPINLNRRFDLVISLEVAEHIDESYSEVFVKSLISLGDIVVFSAAVPYQRGTNHVNEQLPSYWKRIFEKYNYIMYDIIREQIWCNAEINTEYKQNTFLYVNSNRHIHFEEKASLVDFVHPDMLQQSTLLGEKWANSILAGSLGVKASLMIFLRAVSLYVKRRFFRSLL